MRYFVRQPRNALGLKSGKHYFLNKLAPKVKEMLDNDEIVLSSDIKEEEIKETRKPSKIVAGNRSRKKSKRS